MQHHEHVPGNDGGILALAAKSPYREHLAGEAGLKSNLSIAPVVLIYLHLEMYFLLVNPPCIVGVLPYKNGQSIKIVVRLGDKCFVW